MMRESEEKDEVFEGWAIIELFGHNQIAGYVTSAAIFGTSMMRVDVPCTDSPGYTKFFGGAAIYAITPTTEEIAKVAAGRLDVRPVETWIVPEPKRPQLPHSIPYRAPNTPKIMNKKIFRTKTRL